MRKLPWPVRIGVGVALVAVAVGGFARWRGGGGDGVADVPLSRLVAAIAAGEVVEAEIADTAQRVTVTLDDGRRWRSGYPYRYSETLTEALLDAGVEIESEAAAGGANPLYQLFLVLAPVLLLMAFFVVFLGRRLGLGGVLGRRADVAAIPTTRFSDVAGLDEAIEELAEVVEFLHAPERFTAAGARIPKGVLLVGPPGTGKTLLARAVAGEAGVPFYALSGSDFVETFVGLGAARVRRLFADARKRGRAIIFIDELDAVGRARSAAAPIGGAEERESTLNQLLVEMDGFAQSGVIVLAATNRPEILDRALLRPGRFDRRILVPAPDRRGREQILALHAAGKRLAADVDLAVLARRCAGFTGADLANLMNEAALSAGRRGRVEITRADLDEALETVVLGRARRSAVMTERDREIVAWHEAGHATVALCDPHAEDPVSVTIVPRGTAGGATWTQEAEEHFRTRSQWLARLRVLLGGRAAERRHLGGDVTNGARDDLRQATELAEALVCEWGMGDLGPMTIDLDAPLARTDEVRAAVRGLLEAAQAEAERLLTDHAELCAAIAERLLADETVDADTLAVLAAAWGEARDAAGHGTGERAG